MTKIFFDNNATTKMHQEVLEAVVSAYQKPLNASSIHSFGREATKFCNIARDKIVELLNAKNYPSLKSRAENEHLKIWRMTRGLVNAEYLTCR
jgi:cysteine sulfinate desulfinase/cysteine desulfurase-like protein